MTTLPDGPDFDLDFALDLERSRAAVAVACLRWLRCTGPAVASLPEPETEAVPDEPPADPRHPLWDRWLDG